MKKIVLFAMLLTLNACGGGGTTGSTAKATVTGTASEGVLITGKTVMLKDANGNSAVDTTTDATTGTYSIDVTGLAAPFLLTITGINGTYISLAQATGTANINPITTTVVALAAGTSDVVALFHNLTPVQLATINTNYTAKSALVTTSLQPVLPVGVKVEDYFIGTITAGAGMDAVFDTYQIAIHPTDGITVKTKDAASATVLAIPAATVAANNSQPLPIITQAPTAPSTSTSTPTDSNQHLWGGNNLGIYLGCLTCSRFDSDSVCNSFGEYGSSFSSSSIWNSYGTYGSTYEPYSPWNTYSSSGPGIFSTDGLTFYGYFTTNSYMANRTKNSVYLSILDYYISTRDKSLTRIYACGK